MDQFSPERAQPRGGMDHPVGFAQRREPFGESTGLCQFGEITEEPQLSCTVQSHEAFDKQPPEFKRQANDPGDHL